MNTVVNRLLDIDRRARRMLDEAIEYHQRTLDELEVEKARMREEYASKAREHLAALAAEESALIEEEAARIRQSSAALRAAMETRYQENRAAWVDAIVRACIGEDAP